MRNLFRFIQRYHFFFLFLVFGTVAIALTASYQSDHRAFFIHSANVVSGKIYQAFDDVTAYLALKQVNRKLLDDNTRLLNRQRENFVITDTDVFISADSIFQRRFSYMHARVINNSVTRRDNYLTLNKGLNHGVAPDMGVIAGNGVVGIVRNVSANFSVAMSVLHSDMLLSVKIKKNDHIGSLHWEGNNYREAHMTYIPPHVELAAGDTIVTSGYSVVFPENILIGTIKDWEIRRGETFFTATIDLALDLNKISYAYIVKNLMQDEQKELELSVTSDI